MRPIVVRKDQKCAAAKTLADAFQKDPLFAYFFPNYEERLRKLQVLFNLIVQRGLANGVVTASSEKLKAVSIWFPPDGPEESAWTSLRSNTLMALVEVGIGSYGKIWRFASHADTMRTRHAPAAHWFLQAIGVIPQSQGKGYGTTLLRTQLAILDRYKVTCYLSSQCEETLAFFERQDFKVVHISSLPCTDIKSWALLRRPTAKLRP
jgi:GNAT superfamily N-acetyltransferase